MSYTYSDDGYFTCVTPLCDTHGFRWHPSYNGPFWQCATVKPAMDEGKPAELRRSFTMVVDNFGQLVEVPA